MVQDMNSFAKGKSLFQSGLLSEAVLAFEAEVQRQPQNVEAWRLLGTVHAENDDDQQVSYLQPFRLHDQTHVPMAAADDYPSLTLIETAHVFDFDEAAVSLLASFGDRVASPQCIAGCWGSTYT